MTCRWIELRSSYADYSVMNTNWSGTSLINLHEFCTTALLYFRLVKGVSRMDLSLRGPNKAVACHCISDTGRSTPIVN